ncbi:MAG: histidine kinase [Actinomycetota bacterium]|nr:histidine kinase [Actinomycetota bacterium]
MTEWRELARDAAVPVALAALTVVDIAGNGSSGFPEPLWLTTVVLVGAALALVARRHGPAPVVVASSTLVAIYLLMLSAGDPTQQPAVEPFLVLLVGIFALGRHAEGWPLAVGAGLSAVLLLGAELATVAGGRPALDALPTLLFWAAAGALGHLLRRRHREAVQAREQAQRAEADRDAHARQAATQERTRIARELHDVVAHSLSVIVIQASVEARLLGGEDDGSSARTLRTIEETGREALGELRRLLGLLRMDEEPDEALQPMPALHDLDALVQQLRRTGVDVELEVTGEQRSLPPGVDLSAYRIAQEALTNAFRHAPGSSVRVRIGYLDHAVTVAIEDDGTRDETSSVLGGGGHGLVGMRERVRLYGGRLEAGPRQHGGFGVRALIPTVSEGA